MSADARLSPEPRWPALVVGLAIGFLYYSVPESLTFGPGWLLIAVTPALSLPAMAFHRSGLTRWNEIFGYAWLSIITLALAASLALLITRLPAHKDPPLELLRAAAALWVSNILVFASWYWRLDGGGPNERDRRGIHLDGAFLFPQMTMAPDLKKQMGEAHWSPGFIDYLFLAFNTSTAFSPTDVPVLSRWAKLLMIVQSLISLATVALLAARAVNIL
ncbi:MAG: hypothetical protein KGN84_02140 [Acidobacteriota bacterium]|nr:hypothetical protein [Acidobacteriota bacterium]